MGNNVFVSYKYHDSNVKMLNNDPKTTVRNYVDEIKNMFDKSDIFYFRGEKDGEDLSSLSDDTVKSILSDKIFYTSITIILMSPGMREKGKKEKDQWIPWEISYSLKNNSRQSGTSGMNAILAVALPDKKGDYEYAIEEHDWYRTIKTDTFFKIISENMFNSKNPEIKKIEGKLIYYGEHSYIPLVKWDFFCSNKQLCLNRALKRKEECELYTITKTIDNNW